MTGLRRKCAWRAIDRELYPDLLSRTTPARWVDRVPTGYTGGVVAVRITVSGLRGEGSEVGAVYDEFVRELAGWERRYADQPRTLLVRLFLLALEREEIVSIAYRESLISARLARMPLAPEVRELIRHALLWAWKDEEMHALYIRGAILKLGNRRLRMQAFLKQAAGAVAGWSSSAQQHVPWSQAPLARSFAALVVRAGVLTGQVPRDVRQYLQYGPFRDFALFNVEAEKTAWLCWSRIAELAAAQPDLTPALIGDFRRVHEDEDRHRRLFEILAGALDEHDHLVPGETAETLAEKFAAVGEFFLPRRLRGTSVAGNPLGSGGRVWVVRGRDAPEKLPLFRRLLDEAGLGDRIAARARALGKAVSELRVVIKPSFMLGYDRKHTGHITDPALVNELARWLRERGCADLAVVESRNIYDRFYRQRTVQEVARYFGFESPDFRVGDLTEEQVAHVFGRGMAQHSVGRTWKEADFRISFGKMRSHPVELVYLTVPNLEALGSRCEEFLFVDRQAERATGTMMLLSDFPPHFALLDAYDQAADGLVGMMGCARPKAPRRLYAAADALALDLVAARHMHVSDPHGSPILRTACHWFGDPSEATEVVGCDERLPAWRGPYHSEWSTLLSFLAYPVYSHGSGQGALFVPEMDEHAFPPPTPEGSLLRAARRAVRHLLGLHHRS